jgi:hypothetical protein
VPGRFALSLFRWELPKSGPFQGWKDDPQTATEKFSEEPVTILLLISSTAYAAWICDTRLQDSVGGLQEFRREDGPALHQFANPTIAAYGATVCAIAFSRN